MSRNAQTSEAVDKILKGLTVTGMVGAAFVAPNALQLADAALRHLDKRERKRESQRLLSYMKRKQLVNYLEQPDGSLIVTVTRKGKERARKVRFERLTIQEPKVWDGNWRMVMFDVPEARRKSRAALTLKLKTLGFYQLQRSVWVYPYPCRKEVDLMRQVFEVRDSEIIVATISTIDKDDLLRIHFKL